MGSSGQEVFVNGYNRLQMDGVRGDFCIFEEKKAAGTGESFTYNFLAYVWAKTADLGVKTLIIRK